MNIPTAISEREIFLRHTWAELSLQAREKACFPPYFHDHEGALIQSRLPVLAKDINYYYDRFTTQSRHSVARWIWDVSTNAWVVTFYAFSPEMGYGPPLAAPTMQLSYLVSTPRTVAPAHPATPNSSVPVVSVEGARQGKSATVGGRVEKKAAAPRKRKTGQKHALSNGVSEKAEGEAGNVVEDS